MMADSPGRAGRRGRERRSTMACWRSISPSRRGSASGSSSPQESWFTPADFCYFTGSARHRVAKTPLSRSSGRPVHRARRWRSVRDDRARRPDDHRRVVRDEAVGARVDALVTGGTGFVGANIVRELLLDGASVRVLARKGSDRRGLDGCAVEFVDGDLLDPASVRAAVVGAREVYHAAADYRLWAPDPRALYRTNVDGTRHVLEAAAEAGARRIVYTSTVGAVGIPKDGTPGDETTHVSLDDMTGAYKSSKFLAERVAEELAARGAPIVIVNPSAPIGPWDVKPTPTGQMVVDFLRGKMVATLDTGLNLVHVRDVARGHILAAERGRVGERYILGHENCSLLEIFQRLA